MLLTQDELTASMTPDPEVAAILSRMPAASTGPPDYFKMRNALNTMEQRYVAQLGPTPYNMSENDHPVEMRDGYVHHIKIFKRQSSNPGALIILIHAGGFVGGSKEQFTAEARALVQLFDATVVNVAYRQAPEHKFPTPTLDVWDSCKWISDNASDPVIDADPTQGFIIGGASVGGAMTAVLSRKFIDEPLSHPLTGQWLSASSLMDDDCVLTRFRSNFIARKQSDNTPILNKASLEAIQRWSQWDASSDLRYAVNSKTDISKQPRAYLQVSAMDPYRDDTLIYHEMLQEAGVETKIDLYVGCPHLHWLVMPELEVSKRTRVETILGFAWLLRKAVDYEDVDNAIKLP